MAKRSYTTPDGKKYPLIEADYDMDYVIYKSDLRKAVRGDPVRCIEAMGICHNANVVTAWVGAGKDAIVVFKGRKDEPDVAVHFIIRKRGRTVVDEFDTTSKTKSQIKTQTLTLGRVPTSWTLEARARFHKLRQIEIKKGAKVRKTPDKKKARRARYERLGVPRRPRPKIINDGSVDSSAT